MIRHATFLALSALVMVSITKAQTPTWSNDVATIVYSKCTPCHRTGEIAPFTLESYDDAANRSGSIKRVVQSRIMPPWPPAAGHGDFMGNRSLSDAEISTISAWVDAGAPSGDLDKAPKPPTFPSGSQLGTPDLVLEMSETWHIKGNNKDVYRFFVLPTNLLEGKDVSAVEFRPGNASVVHHVLYFLDTSGVARQKDAADTAPGYAGFGDPGFETASSFLGWVPGAQQRFFPPEIGVKFYKNSDLVIQVHYAPSESDQTDKSHVNVFFHKTPATRLVQEFALSPAFLIPGQNFVIPANTSKTFTTKLAVPFDISLIGIAPHMHLLGQNARAYAVSATNDTTNLVKIDDWDFHWQGGYAYRNPVKISRGSTLYYVAEYDNTTSNRENPNSPPKTVRWGESTTDEMLLCYFHWIAYLQGDESLNMETTPTTSVAGDDNNGGERLTVYPSPSRGDKSQVAIETIHARTVRLQVVDLTGKVVVDDGQQHELVTGLNILSLNTGGLASGQYIVRIEGYNDGVSVPFIVAR
ncbi:MAG: T9SS type A sorting domain-containing protein [Candidatus Kapabacteria bacterium]|nr:T9SS type A sorting domain-containing protein [Candidatus Kapabacteria bacterium]